MGDKLNNLSVPLYRILVKVGASERRRQLHQHTATTEEIIETVYFMLRHGRKHIRYYCGSSFEGSVTTDMVSDVDVVHCLAYLPVVLDIAAAPPGVSFLMVRDSWTPPGYCKLQCVMDGRLLYDDPRPNTDHFGIDYERRACKKHFKGDNMHGPASMGIDANGVHFMDHVAALKCDSIPPSELQWIMRRRPYNWPSLEQLHTMSRLGCMVVGVGKSSEHELEWRISYSLQERMLMKNLNPTQHKMTPVRMWTPFNLINCLLQCLKLMDRWLRTGHYPSFLVQDQNLFAKEDFFRVRRRLLGVMEFLFRGGRQFLYMLHSDNIGTLIRNGDCRMLRDVRFKKRNKHIFDLKERQIRAANYTTFSLIHNMIGDRMDPFSISFVLNNAKKDDQINGHTAEETHAALEHLFPWLHLHIANGLASAAITCPDGSTKADLERAADFHLQQARSADLVNSRLAKATAMYASGQYEGCFLLLQQVDNDFMSLTGLYCPCNQTSIASFYNAGHEHKRTRQLARLSVHQIIASHTACCVVFLPSAAAIVPEPLIYEMQRSTGTPPGSRDKKKDFWFDWALVDARSYLYFLQYLVSTTLQRDAYRQVARDNLRAEVLADDRRVTAGRTSHLGHKETSYNLMGWIYMREGQFSDALMCFETSLRIRPLHNAAKHHMRDWIAMRSATHGQS